MFPRKGIAGNAGLPDQTKPYGRWPWVAAHMLGVTITAPDRPAAPGQAPEDVGAVGHLPRLPVNGRFGRSEIDRRAAGVVAAARDGVVSAAHARRVIAALLYGSSIPESVAAGWSGDRQYRVDIADRLRLLLFTKVMQEHAGGLQLDRLDDGASASGWATRLCRAALPSAARDVRLRQRDRPHPPVGAGPVDDAARGFRTITEVSDLVSPASPDFSDGVVTVLDRSLGGDVTVEAAAEAGLLVVSGMRAGSRRHRGAAHLRRALGIPSPTRPTDPAARQRIAAALDGDPAAARRSVRTELARRSESMSDWIGSGDPLAALWAGYPLEALLTLADRDHRYSHVVAAGAVGPRPAIRADVAAALTAQVRRAELDDPGWHDMAAVLVAAFLAHISDLPSEFSPAHRTAPPKSAEEKASEAAAFAEYAGRAAAYPAAPLGSVPAMVEAELQERLALIEAVVADLRHRPAA